MTDKLQKLQAMLVKTPSDPFLLYGIGMEQKNQRELAEAISCFDQTIAADPAYCYAYYQRGQVLEMMGEVEQAKESYRAGIGAAMRVGDAHAASELQAALDLL